MGRSFRGNATILRGRGEEPSGRSVSCPHYVPLVRQVVGHVYDDRVGAVQQRPLEALRLLVVQRLLPEVSRNELRQDDGDDATRMRALEAIYVSHDGFHERAIG